MGIKVFKVWVDECGYDEYDAFVVADDSKAEVLKKVENRQIELSLYNYERSPYGKLISKTKREIHIEEISENSKYDKFTIVLSSYREG